MLNRLLGKFSKDLGIDLGTANTLVFAKDRGILIQEPSVVAINTRTDQILAIGRDARDMLGKTPPHIRIVKPLTKGVISDFEVTEKMLKFFIDKVHRETKTFLPRPRVVIGVPPEITEVERKAVEDAVFSGGAREVFLVDEPMLAAIGCRLPVSDSVGTMIVDIGGGTTDIAVISLAGVVTWKSLPVAGAELDRNIVTYSRDVFNLLLGERNAELAKIRVGSVITLEEPLEMELRGRDLLSGLPKELTVHDSQIREALHRSVRTIVDNVKAILEVTPPELVADIYERGIVLCGGGALLRGLDKLLCAETSIPVRVTDDPLTCVVRGAGALLDNDELLHDVVLPSSRHGDG
jgi:rod shape-determining protein MreB